MLKEISKDEFLECLPERERIRADKDFTVLVDDNDMGNFSVVVIKTKTQMFCGASKRNPCDRRSEAGLCIAAVRAWRSYHGNDPGYSRQRPVSKADAKRISVDVHVERVLDDLGIKLT